MLKNTHIKKTKSLNLIFLSLTLVLLLAATSHSAVLYVDADASGNYDGSSWENAFSTLQDALSAASSSDQIWVAAGTYYPDEGTGQTDGNRSSSFYIPSDVKVYGGFDGTDGAGGGALETSIAQQDWKAYVTVLSGDLNQDDNAGGDNSENAYRVIYFYNVSEQTVLDGFTITSANNNSGGGGGGGILNNSYGSSIISNPQIRNCTIIDNYTHTYGGGVYNWADQGSTANPTLTNCIISNNSGYNGGGFFNISISGCIASPTLINCIISENEADYGGGIQNNESGTSNPTLTNCIISGNQALKFGGGIWNGSFSGGQGTLTLTNCTISGNKTVYDDWIGLPPINGGGGIFHGWDAKISLINCILWDNASQTVGNEILIYSSPPTYFPSFMNCNIKGSGGSTSWDNSLGTDNGGNIDADPLFVDPPDPAATPTTAGDVHLLGGSPCIDQGTATGAPATDIDGDTRDATPDIGADEVHLFFVDADATGNNDGSSWEDAYMYLEDALHATSPHNQIWVAAGTYYPDEGTGKTDGNRSSPFNIPGDVKVYGGFDGTDGTGGGTLETSIDQRDWDTHVTTLSGDLNQDDTAGGDNSENSYNVVYFYNVSEQTVLDGFTITAGNATGGIRSGGGIINRSDGSGVISSPQIRNCTISHNHSSSTGGGIHNSNGDYSTANPTLANCIISNNSSATGGGFFNTSDSGCTANPTLINCIISGNEAFHGGGIQNQSGSNSEGCSPTLINCIISGNHASMNGGYGYGGGIWNGNFGDDNCIPVLINCTISANWAASDDFAGGGGAIYSETSPIQFINCTLWNNRSQTGNNEILLLGTPVPVFTNCNVKGSGGSTSWDTSLGTDNGGNIDADPLFVDPPDPTATPTTAGDVHLLGGSPCMDQGTTSGAPATDIDGDTRDATPDIGVDEVTCKSAPTPPPALTSPTGTVNQALPIYTWDSNPCADAYKLKIQNQLQKNIFYQWYPATTADNGDGTCSINPGKVLAPGSYFWLVKARNQYGEGDWSAKTAITVVTTQVPPVAPSQNSPTGATADTTPDFDWDSLADIDYYELCIQNRFQKTIYKKRFPATSVDNLDGTCTASPGKTLAADDYYWMVRARNQYGLGPWSTKTAFTVQ